MKFLLTLFISLIGYCALSQNELSNYRAKKVAVKDSIVIDSVSINSSSFLVKTKENIVIDSTFYSIDFGKAVLTFKKPITTDSIIIDYLRYPEFLTKTYQQLDEDIIVESTSNQQKLYTF
jgi:hypothetical protein